VFIRRREAREGRVDHITCCERADLIMTEGPTGITGKVYNREILSTGPKGRDS